MTFSLKLTGKSFVICRQPAPERISCACNDYFHPIKIQNSAGILQSCETIFPSDTTDITQILGSPQVFQP